MPSSLKDDHLTELSERFNVAQFVSFSPALEIRHSRIRGAHSGADSTVAEAVSRLLAAADAGTVNVRSFAPGRTKGNPFEYGLAAVDDVIATVRRLAAEGLFTIVNETIPIDDGGVSGVAMGGVVEFAPNDTPRAVERPGVASLPIDLARAVLTSVYGLAFEVTPQLGERLEWSLHPRRVGFRKSHTLIWEYESVEPVEVHAIVTWPNRFSRFIGDKAFGLLVADALGLPVPATTAISRAVSPFRFGRSTGTGEVWIRTCPVEQVPGKYTTEARWLDPFELLQREDPDGTAIASVLAQEGVDARFSGATLPRDDADYDYVEGVRGRGDMFMLSQAAPEELPADVVRDVRALTALARKRLGAVRVEWVHDGERAWVVQMHLSRDHYTPGVINPGTPANGWLPFDVTTGLETLRGIVTSAREQGKGVEVMGSVGLTSHVGDLLRKGGVPARLARPDGD